METLITGPWGRFAAAAVVIFIVAQLAHRLLWGTVLRLAGYSTVLAAVLRRSQTALQWAVPLVALQVALRAMPEDAPGLAAVEHVNGVLLITAFTALGMAAVRGVADGVVLMHPSTAADNLAARRVHTQTRVLSRIAAGAVFVAGLSFILMTFPRARELGASVLASAGVAGLVVGLAARSVFSNLLAGLQIALAQPIRIDDVLIVENEWGRVEEITATYVVLRLWDERRLVVPLGWFIDHPFQNWTRRSSELMGTVFLWVDFTLPVEAIRAEARRLCEASKNWDGRVCVVQVTDTSDQAMQLRILASSADAGRNFDLRCELREGLIAYIGREHPKALPRTRASLDAPVPATAPAPAAHAAGPATPSPAP